MSNEEFLAWVVNTLTILFTLAIGWIGLGFLLILVCVIIFWKKWKETDKKDPFNILGL